MPTGIYRRTKKTKKAISNGMKRLYENPEEREKRRKGTIKRFLDIDEIEIARLNAIESWENPIHRKNRIDGMKNHDVSESTKIKIGNANRGKCNPRKGLTFEEYFGEAKAREIKQKYSVIRKELNLKPMLGKHHSNEAKEKMREKRFQNMKNNPTKYQSSWEEKFFEFIKICFPIFEIKRQFRLPKFKHPFDFAIPELELLFEIDGKYWHQKHLERDAFIDDYVLENSDWCLIRLDDDDLKEKLKIIK